MLSKRLEELSRDPNDPDGIAELAVTALGTGGKFYICWKTPLGQYRQGEPLLGILVFTSR